LLRRSLEVSEIIGGALGQRNNSAFGDMSAIFGWINAAHEPGAEENALDAMAQAIRSKSARRKNATAPGCKMSAISGLVDADSHAHGTLLVALQGEVRFETHELARHAAQFGAAAAVARAYEVHGLDCLRHMRGTFAVAIADGTHRRGLLAIDRMAIRTLSYARAAGGVVFSTSASAVAAHPAVGRRLSRQGIYNYLYCEDVPAPGTIFEKVAKLQPGQRVVIEGDSVRTDFYWTLQYLDAGGEPEEALRAEFQRLLRECVARAAPAGDAGTFLSGGTDSSTVTGILTELRGGPIDTYSIGFEAEGYDEMQYARIAARHFASRSHEHYVTPRDVAAAVPLIATMYDEPFGNASAVPTYYCAKLAKDDGRELLLAGDGGDEIFGGNARYARQKIFEAYWLLPRALRRGLVEPLLFNGDWVERIMPLRKARSYVQQARIPLPDRIEAYNFLEREALAEIFEPDFLDAVDPHQPRDIARDVYQRTTSPAAVNRMMHLDLKDTLADNDLRKVNGMCELAGIRVRYPLLDDDLVAFSARLTPAQKVRRLRLRHFFKEALRELLPPETITKSKHGFGLPFGLWMQRDEALREMATESLRSFGARGVVKPEFVERLLHLHRSSHADYYGVMIWIVMMLERWLALHEPTAAPAEGQRRIGANIDCARV
jgi:asparagine synthase (glutamine-hydrolysing)